MTTRVLREPLVITDVLRDRFFSKTVAAETGCLIWTGAVQRNGYGAFRADGLKHDAHVLAWRIGHNGAPVPLGNLVMHTCDCRPCVNPAHLVLGTASQNIRQAHVSHRGDDFVCRGEDHPDSVLTEEVVRSIRRMYKPRTFSYRRIAAQLGLNEFTVRSVVLRKTWRHVSDEIGDEQ